MVFLGLVACLGSSGATALHEPSDTGDPGADDTGDSPGPVSIVEVTNAATVASEGFVQVFAEADDVVAGYHYIGVGETDQVESDVEGQSWLGFSDRDGNCAAFEVWLDFDAPQAVTITGFAGTWDWDILSCS